MRLGVVGIEITNRIEDALRLLPQCQFPFLRAFCLQRHRIPRPAHRKTKNPDGISPQSPTLFAEKSAARRTTLSAATNLG